MSRRHPGQPRPPIRVRLVSFFGVPRVVVVHRVAGRCRVDSACEWRQWLFPSSPGVGSCRAIAGTQVATGRLQMATKKRELTDPGPRRQALRSAGDGPRTVRQERRRRTLASPGCPQAGKRRRCRATETAATARPELVYPLWGRFLPRSLGRQVTTRRRDGLVIVAGETPTSQRPK